MGAPEGNSFSPIVASNRQTENDIRNSGMEWAIGRNGIYIEPDLDYLDHYKKQGRIVNSAANGRCGYTSRSELAHAYSKVALHEKYKNSIYNLFGEAITQTELAEAINQVYGLNLKYVSVAVEEYLEDRIAGTGEFLGNIIGGIYHGIRDNKFMGPSHFEQVVGRPHKSLDEMIITIKKS